MAPTIGINKKQPIGFKNIWDIFTAIKLYMIIIMARKSARKIIECYKGGYT